MTKTLSKKRRTKKVQRGGFMEFPNLNIYQEKILLPHIINLVGSYYSIAAGYETSQSRKNEDVKPKHICMYLMVNSTKKVTINKLGQYFNVGHSNIIHAYNKISNYLIYDKQIQIEVNEIRKSIEKKAIDIANTYHNEVKESENYNYIDLNEFTSMKFGSKYLIGVNTTHYDIECLKFIFGELEIKKHINTGLFLLEQKKHGDKG